MNRKIIKAVVMLAAISSLATPALAQRGGRGDIDRGRDVVGNQQRLILEMYDQVYQSRHGESLIRLKQLIRRQHGINLRDKKLVSVKLVAKSARGRGSAELLIGGRRVADENVNIYMGRRHNNLREAFQSSRPRTYDRVHLTPYRPMGKRESWQIDLRGKIKVKRIAVTIKSDRRGPRKQIIHVGSMKPDKVVGETTRFNVNQRNVVEVILEGAKRETEITRVVVKYRNGDRQRLHNLTGYLSKGQIKSARINGRNISQIIIEAVSPNAFRGKGEILVSVGVMANRDRRGDW